MHGLLNQHIGIKLASFVVAFGLAFTSQPIPASANDDNTCRRTIPLHLSPSEFEELRNKIWEAGTAVDLELSFKVNFNIIDYPFFFLLLSAAHAERGDPIQSLITLGALEEQLMRKNYCQNIILGELVISLRHFSIIMLLPKGSRDSKSWDTLRYAGLRFFLWVTMKKSNA